MPTARIIREQNDGRELPTRDYATYAAHLEAQGKAAPTFEEYIEAEQLRQQAAKKTREDREALEDSHFAEQARQQQPKDYDTYAKEQEAKGEPSPSFEEYIKHEAQNAELRSQGFGAIPKDYEAYTKEREKDGLAAPTFEEYIEAEELRRIAAREAREHADDAAREKAYYESQGYEEEQIDARQKRAEQRSRMGADQLQLEEFAGQRAELEHRRMIEGRTEPSFEELRAIRASEGRLLTDEDYQHELANYRRETGLNLADSDDRLTGSQVWADGIIKRKAAEVIKDRETEDRLKKRRFDEASNLESAEFAKGLSSLTYLDVRGAFYKVSLLDSHLAAKARGVYAIEEMEHYARDEEAGQLESPILLTGVETTQRDVTSQMSCLNNTKVFYTFGQSFGNVMISGEILLGPLGNMTVGERGGVRRLLDFFWTYRVSVYEKPITVSISGEAFYVYLTGLGLGKVDPDLHTLSFVLTGTLLDLSREDAGKGINPSSSVDSRSGLEKGLTISEKLLPEQSLRGPAANETATTVDELQKHRSPELDKWADEEAALLADDGTQTAAKKPKTAERALRDAADRSELGKLQQSQFTVSETASERAKRSADIKRAVEEDLKKNGSSGPSVYDQRRSALNHAGWEIREEDRTSDAEQDESEAVAKVLTPEGQARAYTLAKTKNPELFSGDGPEVLRDGKLRVSIPDSRPKEASDMERIKAEADRYVAEKTGKLVEAATTNEEQYNARRRGEKGITDDQGTVRAAYYRWKPNAARIVTNMQALERAAENNQYPKAEYNKLAAEFGMTPTKL